MLMDISSASQVQQELGFDPMKEGQGNVSVSASPPDSPSRDPQRLMAALDAVNQRWGKHTMKLGSHRLDPAPRAWTMKQERRTPRYTTQWEEMPVVRV